MGAREDNLGAGGSINLMNPSESYVNQFKWSDAESVTAAAAGDLAASARAYATVNAAVLAGTAGLMRFQLARGTAAIAMRFISDGVDGDEHVVQIYGAVTGDHYFKIASLNILEGDQVYSGDAHFCDDVQETNVAWFSSTAECNPGNTSNQIAHWVMNAHGLTDIVMVVTTMDIANSTANVYAQIRRL